MKQRLLLFTVPLILLCNFWACSPIYYAPGTQNVPLFKHKGDVRIVPSFGDQRVGLDLAFAPKDDLGMLFSTNLTTISDDSMGTGGSGQLYETGFGYYKEVSPSWTFESFVILGYGRIEVHIPRTINAHPGTLGKIQANIFRYGIQPNLGLSTKYFDVAVSSKISMIKYQNIGGSLIVGQSNEVQYLRDNDQHFLIEPSFTLRAGYKYIKAHLQIGKSFNITNQEFRQRRDIISLGLIYSFPN